MDSKILGIIIRQYRKNKNLSQEVLSGLANIDRSHLSKIELGKRSPTVAALSKIANAMDIKASDILRAAEEVAAKRGN
jgi:transcriptional regulator with XRE-family HTH domain